MRGTVYKGDLSWSTVAHRKRCGLKAVACLLRCKKLEPRAMLIHAWHLQVLKVDAYEGECTVEEGACNVSGLSFTPSGRRLYVGLEGTPKHGIVAFDVQMLSRLTFGSAQYN